MGVLVAARSFADRQLPVDLLRDDPLWSDSDDAAYWQSILDGGLETTAGFETTAGLVDDFDGPGIPPTRREQVAELQCLAAERARLAAREALLLVAISGAAPRSREVSIVNPEDGDIRSFTIVDEALEEVSVALRRSVGSVRRDVAVARTLATLPALARALAEGAVSPAHVEVITRIAEGLPADLLPRFERRVLDRALRSTPGETGAFARRLRARLDTAGEDARRRQAARLVDVRIWAEDDGLACLQARLPVADAARVHAALEARARSLAFEPDQSMGERRVAALVSALCDEAFATSDDGVGPGSSPVPGQPAVAVSVVVDAATLLGLADDPALVDVAADGRVPMTAQALRDLLADPAVPVTLRRLIVDPSSGQVIDRGRRAYRVTDDLRAFVADRDVTCRFPHCRRRADACDVDHVVSWGAGGPTDADNLMSLCRRHHVLKTHGAWSVVHRRPDGTVEWRAPDGSAVVSEPWNRERRRILEPWDPLRQ
jgi:hypothetical protein